MADPLPSPAPRRVRLAHLGALGAQHRNALFLMLNAATGAAAGVLFWVLLTRFAGLATADIGVGYTVVALGTTVGLLAKGGLDTALLRTAPATSAAGARSLLRFASVLAAATALVLAATLSVAAAAGGGLPHLDSLGWLLVAAIGGLLAWTWLQDAHFLAEGDAAWSFRRNLVFSAARLLLPLPIVLLAVPHAIPVAWALALLASGLAALAFAHRFPQRGGPAPDRASFLRSARRNLTGSAAEFLPGLLLAPIVLAAAGAESAAYFGIAWTAASMLFLMSSAVSRSALAELVRAPAQAPHAIRRAVRQNLVLVAPAAVLAVLVAPWALAVFGSDYARNAHTLFVVLCASTALVAPSYLYLSVLRAREQPLALVLFPLGMIAALLVAAPPLLLAYGLAGVGAAWLVANLPFAAYSAWRLRALASEVNHAPAPVGRRADVE